MRKKWTPIGHPYNSAFFAYVVSHMAVRRIRNIYQLLDTLRGDLLKSPLFYYRIKEYR